MSKSKWFEKTTDSIRSFADAEIKKIEQFRDLVIGFAEKMEAIGVVQWLVENVRPQAAMAECVYQFGISKAAKAEEKYRDLVALVVGYSDDEGNCKADQALWEVVEQLSKDLDLSAHGLKVGRYLCDSYQIAIVPIDFQARWWRWEGDEDES